MTPHTGRDDIVLVERRTRAVRLPRADAEYLFAHARHVLDIVPAFEPGVYRLTPRGLVGFLRTPNVRITIRPKVPWPTVALLLGAEQPPAGDADGAVETALLNLLAREVASALREVTRGGLVRGYSDIEHQSAFLRGRLRTADQLRDAARNRRANLFHVEESVFELDTPWNAVPRSVAADLAATPGLDPAVRTDLSSALAPLLDLPARPVTDADFEAASREPRAATYRPLLELCRLVADCQRAAGFGVGHGFLLDLGRAFERYVAGGLKKFVSTLPGLAVDVHPCWEVAWSAGSPQVFQPDIVVRFDGRPVCVLDTKWKRPAGGPDAADIHQVLAYASVTGARHVGLIYPARRSRSESVVVGEGGVHLTRHALKVVGPTGECEHSLSRLARSVLASSSQS